MKRRKELYRLSMRANSFATNEIVEPEPEPDDLDETSEIPNNFWNRSSKELSEPRRS
jgi:hypothetical protein